MKTNMLRRLSVSIAITMFLSGCATCHPPRRGVYQVDLEFHLELVERDSASFMPTVLGETTC